MLGSNDILQLIIGSFDNLDDFYPTQEINSLGSSPTKDQLPNHPVDSQSIRKFHCAMQ